MKSEVNPGVINSIIGYGTVFNGDLDLTGLLKVDGDFSGSIKADGKVLISRTGRARCSIFANTVVVGGIVKGDIYADSRVVVLSTGMVIGNIRAPRLVIEEGVLINGELTVASKEDTEIHESTVDSDVFAPFSQA